MSKKVLVVDDEKLIVKGIRFSLEQGYNFFFIFHILISYICFMYF